MTADSPASGAPDVTPDSEGARKDVGAGEAPGLAPDATRPVDDEPWPEDDEFDDEDRDCLICGGDGFVYGESFGEPLWYDADKVYACKSCGGSGLRKDMTYW